VARPGPDPRSLVPVVLLLALAGAGAAAAPVDPTGSAVGDVVWLSLLGLTVTAAAFRARPVGVLALTGVAGLLTAGWPLALAAGSLGLGLASLGPRHPAALRAVSAALGVNALVRADSMVVSDPLAFVLGAAAVLLVLVDGLLRADPPLRRTALRATVAVGGLCLASVLAAAVATLVARGDLEAGVDAARRGLDLANDTQTDAARARFVDAEQRLRRGHGLLSGPWVLPARALPIVGPNLTAVVELSEAGTSLATSAVAVADAADPSRLLDGARIDLDALVETGRRLHTARAALDDASSSAARLRSPWLVGPVTSRLDLLAEMVDDAQPRVDSLIDVVDMLPTMLGADGGRTYLLLFTTPSETRGLGGFVGNWAIIRIEDGRLELGERGRAADLSFRRGTRDRVISGPQEYLDRYYRYYAHWYPVNITASPDFPTVAQVATELFPQADIPEPDGVILADPSALAALLRVTGPVEVPALDMTFTADNLEQYLWLDQYRLYDSLHERADALQVLVDVMFDRLTSGDLDPVALLDALGPMVEARRLMVWSTVPEETEVLHELGIDGAFPRAEPGQDLVSVRTANANGNKIDVFLERRVRYDATVDPETGDLRATVTVELLNSAWDDPELPNYVLGNFDEELDRGWNRQWVSLYTPHQIVRLEADGEPVEPETIPELGVLTHALYVDVPPQGRVTIVFELRGRVDPERYSLVWSGQPTIHPDEIEIEVDTGRGTLTHDETSSRTFTLHERGRGR
jgi:hypothetical protein